MCSRIKQTDEELAIMLPQEVAPPEIAGAMIPDEALDQQVDFTPPILLVADEPCGPEPRAVPFTRPAAETDPEVIGLLADAQRTGHWMAVVFCVMSDGTVNAARKAVDFPNSGTAVGKCFDVFAQEMVKMAKEQ